MNLSLSQSQIKPKHRPHEDTKRGRRLENKLDSDLRRYCFFFFFFWTGTAKGVECCEQWLWLFKWPSFAPVPSFLPTPFLFHLLSPFTKACVPSFSVLLSGLSSGSCFQKLSSDNKPLVWQLHLFLDTHNLFWMGLWSETQIELTTPFRDCWMPSWVLKIKFQWLASLEQSAKEFPNNKCNKMEKIAFSIILLKESIAYVWENYFDKPLWLGIKPSKHASNKRWSLNCFGGGGSCCLWVALSLGIHWLVGFAC